MVTVAALKLAISSHFPLQKNLNLCSCSLNWSHKWLNGQKRKTEDNWSNVWLHRPTPSFRSFFPSKTWIKLRGAWRDHCFPEPFSWFLHETGLESLKITSARCFLLKCQRKNSKKAKEHRQFRGVLGRWRTAAIDRTTFHACQRCRKTAVFAVFFSALGCHLVRKSLSWPAMPVSKKKQEFEQRKRIKLFDDFWVRAYPFDFAPRRRPRARSK